MTVLQAVFRELKPGETRRSLAEKCRKGLRRKKYLSCDPELDMYLGTLVSNTAVSTSEAVVS